MQSGSVRSLVLQVGSAGQLIVHFEMVEFVRCLQPKLLAEQMLDTCPRCDRAVISASFETGTGVCITAAIDADAEGGLRR